MTPLSKVALVVAAIGSLLLVASYLPPLRPYFDRVSAPSAGDPKTAEASAEPTAAVATQPPEPPPPTYALPVRLRIPKLGVDAAITQVGLGKDGAMESPKGPELAGWYKLGTKPGERGSAVVAGHSGYRGGRTAIFDHLPRLVAGDSVVVVDEAGTAIRFLVRESRLFDPAADAAEVFSRTDGRFLNLVTCTGEWSETAGTHTKRLVVFCDATP